MESTLIVYCPATAAPEPEWLAHLPGHVRLRSKAGLVKALQRTGADSTLRIALLLPKNEQDLTDLAKSAEAFAGWRVLVELPDDRKESIHLAKPLSPRYMSFRGESPEYLAAIIAKMVELNSSG